MNKSTFSNAPTFDEPDFFGGILGKRKDCTLDGKIPYEIYPAERGFIIELSEISGYARSEDKPKDSASYIKSTTYDYYTTYLN